MSVAQDLQGEPPELGLRFVMGRAGRRAREARVDRMHGAIWLHEDRHRNTFDGREPCQPFVGKLLQRRVGDHDVPLDTVLLLELPNATLGVALIVRVLVGEAQDLEALGAVLSIQVDEQGTTFTRAPLI